MSRKYEVWRDGEFLIDLISKQRLLVCHSGHSSEVWRTWSQLVCEAGTGRDTWENPGASYPRD